MKRFREIIIALAIIIIIVLIQLIIFKIRTEVNISESDSTNTLLEEFKISEEQKLEKSLSCIICIINIRFLHK